MPKKQSISEKILSFLEECGKLGFAPELICHFIEEPETKVWQALKSLKKRNQIYQTGKNVTALVFSSKFPQDKNGGLTLRGKGFRVSLFPSCTSLKPPQLPRRTF